MVKYWQLEIDGCDKTGKDTILKYIEQLSNYKYSINSRGILSQLVYNKKYNRNIEYNLSSISNKIIYILLEADIADIKTRCIITNEPSYDIKSDLQLFKTEYYNLLNSGYKCFLYNTSHMTAYEIAKDIIRKVDELNELSERL